MSGLWLCTSDIFHKWTKVVLKKIITYTFIKWVHDLTYIYVHACISLLVCSFPVCTDVLIIMFPNTSFILYHSLSSICLLFSYLVLTKNPNPFSAKISLWMCMFLLDVLTLNDQCVCKCLGQGKDNYVAPMFWVCGYTGCRYWTHNVVAFGQLMVRDFPCSDHTWLPLQTLWLPLKGVSLNHCHSAL